MLDLDHPLTLHIFAAGRLEDGLLDRAERMTLIPTPEREILFTECLYLLDDLRRLNDNHFGTSPFIVEAIDEAEAALRNITYLGGGKVTEDRSDGEGSCAVCGGKITIVGPFPYTDTSIICCDYCVQPFYAPRQKLASLAGFATCAI